MANSTAAFILFMTTGAGVDVIGGWFGTGTAHGIALPFTIAGIVALMYMQTRASHILG